MRILTSSRWIVACLSAGTPEEGGREGGGLRDTRSFPDVSGLVPGFSVLTVGKDLGCEETAVLVPGDDGEPRGFRRDAGEGSLEGLLWEIALRIRSRRRGTSVPR